MMNTNIFAILFATKGLAIFGNGNMCWVVVEQERKRRISMISGGNRVSGVCFLSM
jgi:hypothetical protein